jgi:hypothetical protein
MRNNLRQLSLLGFVYSSLFVVIVTATVAADEYRQLKGRDIVGRFSGMEFSDEVHWAYVFNPDRTVRSFSMGKKSSGKWLVQKDALCIETDHAGRRCYQVWAGRNDVQLRPIGIDAPLEGTIGKPRKNDI